MEILDKFTELQTELQTELKLRKKQYEYYRDKLLTFSEEEREKWGVRDVRIGDVCMILRGKRLTKRDLVDGGDYPVFHGGKEPIGYYHEKNRDANTTMIINTGDCGCVSWSDKDF
ncbi:MAG: restriction endonuclease subunit S, partial [Rickettsiales bacterium]|nr:restriction endonuclease subunit S [Rickettsiales bacterium]